MLECEEFFWVYFLVWRLYFFLCRCYLIGIDSFGFEKEFCCSGEERVKVVWFGLLVCGLLKSVNEDKVEVSRDEVVCL